MVILRFTDVDDDGVAIESAAIVAVSVGRLQKPMVVEPGDDRDPHVVTLVHTLAGPLVVRQDAHIVVQVWQEALTVTPPVKAHREVMGWLSQYFHPSVLRPEPPAWDSKALSVSKEVEP
jgi:hypothetical protein